MLLDHGCEKLEVAREDLELADGHVRVVGAPDERRDRRARRLRGAVDRQGLGPSARESSMRCRGLPRPARQRVVPRAAGLHPRGPRQGRPRDGRRPRPPGQPPRTTPARSSTGSARAGRSTAGSSWASARRCWRCPSSTPTGASATRTCSTTSSSPPPTRPRIDVAWIETPAENGGPLGTKGVGEPPTVPTPERSRTRSRASSAPDHGAADDARARLGRRLPAADDLRVRLGRHGRRGPRALASGARPVAGGPTSSSARARARRRFRRASSPSTGSTSFAGSSGRSAPPQPS